ncbi:hypothetical protein [Enterococcus gallinarum]|uniref:hypothetical protein n=1 Tax=Enterococcus gallinarum TaxID=1353 RepID=UPI001472E9D5|nr:hypothetical protein [Enterococcus gallinarum]MCI5685522.1 hypothetical protein [Enterococcus gallinarum]MDV7823086.1 hypothetical protein [Enterococcus gallinarum]MDV7873735.1 hypothetical protein [Enterococcus gallinarum]MDY4072393.1 hypothetical protein [Enterococcus gallinarum]NME46622.1 hypothetical protein [Enterococcus gallinarum]
MKQIFNIDGEVYSFLQKIYQMMLLNLLIIFSSLPIITVPCALITGYQLLKEYNQQEVTLTKYFMLFRKNLILSFRLIIAFGVIFFLLFLLLAFTRRTIFQFLILLFIVFLSNVFIVCTSQMSIRSIVEFSLGITLKYVGCNIIGLAIMLSSFVLPVFLPRLALVWALFGISIPMVFQVMIHKQIMKHVTTNQIEQE